MTTIESILNRLTKTVHGTDREFYTEEERIRFARSYLSEWDETTTGEVIAKIFVDYWWNSNKECRRCSVCGKLMRTGYCVSAGEAYYCSDECLHQEFTDEEWAKQYEDDDESYYTEWY